MSNLPYREFNLFYFNVRAVSSKAYLSFEGRSDKKTMSSDLPFRKSARHSREKSEKILYLKIW